MSFDQSRSDKNDTHFRKSGRSLSFNQQRGSSGAHVKGGSGPAPLPSITLGPSLSSNWSFKKSNNVQGVQSRVNQPVVDSTENNGASTPWTVQNGSHVQQQLHGTFDAPIANATAKSTELSAAQRSTGIVPKAPTSQPSLVSSDPAAPITPAKAQGDASKALAFQFGSMSPGFMNGMVIPARTSFTPPHLDEQKHDQARHDAFRPVPSMPTTPPVPKQQPPTRYVAVANRSHAAEAYSVTRAKKQSVVSPLPPANQMQKPSVVPMAGLSMAMPSHQSQASVQFGGPDPQIQSQGMSATSLLMPLPIGNAPQIQQPVFVSGLQPHPMHPQGIMHQGQNMSFTTQMGPQLPHQLGNMGISINPQYPQQQGAKFGERRKTTVKITPNETHEELRLDKWVDAYSDGWSQGARSHPNVPSQLMPDSAVQTEDSVSVVSNNKGKRETIRADIAEALMSTNISSSHVVEHDSNYSPGRIIDRSGGASLMDCRGSSVTDKDRWSKFLNAFGSGRLDAGFGGNSGFRPGEGGNFGILRNLRAQAPLQYAGGILPGPMQSMGSQGGMQRNKPDSETWQHAASFQQSGLIPSPQTPWQMMHKAEKKYEVGKVTDEEEAKQRQLKAILNKLTPQNFERLFEQVRAVNIDNAVTLTGLTSQIFEKALMEPIFCKMYANLCLHLALVLPDFTLDNEKITFRRLLLNKCQEEFERGEREQEEANKAEEDKIRQSAEELEEKRTKARRRMLGNIRLIGELYKKKMLTERIMHECIKKLLGQYQDPDEDIEALCTLMSIIGEIIDHPKSKNHIDTYFEMMKLLSDNMSLSSRVRFMLKDAIDLRKNKWQQKREVEGPN